MAMTLITTNTSSGATTSSFTSGIDSTYKLYIFKFIDLNPSGAGTFQFQANVVGGSGYNETITSSYFKAYHNEGDSATALTYDDGEDQAQGTAFQNLANSIGEDADQCAVGELHLFNPSNTTYVKHFYSRIQFVHASDYSQDHYCGGYFNVTAAIDDIQFKYSAGTMDAVIKMWGVS